MKLKNKKTGEIVNAMEVNLYTDAVYLKISKDGRHDSIEYGSLAELNADWEDAPEEPKKYWFIDFSGEVKEFELLGFEWQDWMKEIGNYFETKEEAEKSVEKLKAWKRLKDKGFRLDGWTIDDGLRISICTNTDSEGIYDDDKKEMKKDLDICFGVKNEIRQ